MIKYILPLLICNICSAIGLAWNRNPEPDIAGYNIYWKTSSESNYINCLPVGNTNYINIDFLLTQTNQTYYFVCTALNTQEQESDYSNEASYFNGESFLTLTLTNEIWTSFFVDTNYSLLTSFVFSVSWPNTNIFFKSKLNPQK